jgi:putative phosphoribosyl transferase
MEAPIVLALARGGVPVGYAVASALGAPLDVWVARKVCLPSAPEVGLGAVSEGGVVDVRLDVVDVLGVPGAELEAAIAREREIVQARVWSVRGDRPPPTLRGHTVILVDDGAATGCTARGAIRAIRSAGPRDLILAVPVASPEALDSLAPEVEHVVCPLVPAKLCTIGLWYEDFRQVTDEEVVRLLEQARSERAAAAPGTPVSSGGQRGSAGQALP